MRRWVTPEPRRSSSLLLQIMRFTVELRTDQEVCTFSLVWFIVEVVVSIVLTVMLIYRIPYSIYRIPYTCTSDSWWECVDQESEYGRRMIVVNPDRALLFGCRNYHVLKSGHIQLKSYRWNNLLRVASLGREVSVRSLEFWSNRSFFSSTAHSLNFLQ